MSIYPFELRVCVCVARVHNTEILFLLVADDYWWSLSLSSQLVVSNEEAGDFKRDFFSRIFWRKKKRRPTQLKKNSKVSCRPPLFFAFSLSLTITTTTNTARDGEKQGGGEEEEEYDDDENKEKEKEKWTRH